MALSDVLLFPALFLLVVPAWNAPSITQLSPARRALDLNGTWQLTYGAIPAAEVPAGTRPPAGWPTIPATVPGNVELDLMRAGKLPDIEKGSRVYQTRKLESYQWWFRRTFDAPRPEAGERVELVFDGLDCIATVWLNGKLIGHTANMLIPHRLDATAALRTAEPNELVVRIDPAVPAGRRRSYPPGEYAGEEHWESLAIRKAPHMYGWDILPRVVSAGMWRGVRLEFSRPTHWNAPYWATQSVDRQAHRAALMLDWEFVTDRFELDGFRIAVTLRRKGNIVLARELPVLGTRGRTEFTLENADLWWPRGYGDPALYDADLILRDEHGKVLDSVQTRIGIRTVALHRTNITSSEAPGDFSFLVNGVKVFIKGTNWVPLDALHSRDSQHLDQAIAMLRDVNCNMVRCWGGNVYESNRFFDLCDQSGILVWQDFALGCATYPQTDEFAATMRDEAESVVERLRNHASLALWAGNNENDEAFSWNGLQNVDPNRDRLSRQVLPAAVYRMDPRRDYLPSSPYRSPELFAAGNDPKLQPEVHLWGPRGYFKDPFYTDVPAHFVSEIGYHGCPARASLERMFDADSVFPWKQAHEWNDEWLTKSVRSLPNAHGTDGRNDLMIKQINAFFGEVPASLDEFILASQITQAEAMKFFVDFWRQGKGQRWGILWWNLRDGWPLISDAVVDYYNRPKLAYTYLRDSQRNVQAICTEERNGQHALVIVNDTLAPVRGRLRVTRAGESIALLERDFSIDSNGRTEAGTISHPTAPEMWKLDWQVENGEHYTTHYLATDGKVKLAEYQRWMKQLGIELPR